jgi:hypothetical protein
LRSVARSLESKNQLIFGEKVNLERKNALIFAGNSGLPVAVDQIDSFRGQVCTKDEELHQLNRQFEHQEV